MAKKAFLSQDALYYLFKVLSVVVVFIAFSALISNAIKKEVGTHQTEADIYAYRFLYSPYALSYHDLDIDRVYPGMIDLKRLMSYDDIDSHLQDMLQFRQEDKGHIAARFMLYDDNKDELAVFYFNEDRFRVLHPLSIRGTGPGTSNRFEYAYYVQIKDNRSVELFKLESRLAASSLTPEEEESIREEITRITRSQEFSYDLPVGGMLRITVVMWNR